MLIKLAVFVLILILVVCQASLYHHRYNDHDHNLQNQLKSLSPQQLAELDDYLSRQLFLETATSGEELYRNTRRPHENVIVKRDALWTTTEVLDCIRRLKAYKNNSKLDLVAEMLNCYRRLKQNG